MSEVLPPATPAVTATPATPAAPVVKKREAIVLVEARLGLVEHRRQDWVAIAQESHTIEDVLDPIYWSYVASKFTQYDRVEVRQETGEWIVDLIMVEVGRNFARAFVAAKHDLRAVELGTPAEVVKYKVERKGDHRKWCVIRIADSAMIQEGMLTKALADEWLLNHERVTH